MYKSDTQITVIICRQLVVKGDVKWPTPEIKLKHKERLIYKQNKHERLAHTKKEKKKGKSKLNE